MTVGQHPRSAAPGYTAPHSVPPTVRRPGPPPVGPPPTPAGLAGVVCFLVMTKGAEILLIVPPDVAANLPDVMVVRAAAI